MSLWDAKTRYAFIDESGDSNLDLTKKDISSHFIVTAIIVSEDDVAAFRKEAETVRQKHFQTGEIKSSKVSNDHARRERVLQDICKLNFRFTSLAVDKSAIISTSGLIWKKSFLKFLQGLLYNKLYKAFPSLIVYADEHGRREFMDEFERYILQKHRPTLFTTSEFHFIPSKDEVLVQIADFISGTVAKIMGPNTDQTFVVKFVSLLKQRAISIEEWPPRLATFIENEDAARTKEYDPIVAQQSLHRAISFLEENIASKEKVVAQQIEFVKYLIYVCRFVNPSKYTATEKLRSHLEELLGDEISVRHLRSNIVAKLRDNGLLISSRKTWGYKIPVSVADLDDLVAQLDNKIGPMISRLESVRKQMLLATEGNLDILRDNRYEYLRKLMEAKDLLSK